MVKPQKSLTLEYGQKDFVQQHVIPYIKGHELSVVHDMIEWIVGSIVLDEFWHDEPSWRLVFDDMRAEKRGEHVVQLPTDRVGGTSTYHIPTDPL